jgi:hypothetical protein
VQKFGVLFNPNGNPKHLRSSVNLGYEARTRRKVPWIIYRSLNRERILGGPGRRSKSETREFWAKAKERERSKLPTGMEPARRCCCRRQRVPGGRSTLVKGSASPAGKAREVGI